MTEQLTYTQTSILSAENPNSAEAFVRYVLDLSVRRKLREEVSVQGLINRAKEVELRPIVGTLRWVSEKEAIRCPSKRTKRSISRCVLDLDGHSVHQDSLTQGHFWTDDEPELDTSKCK